MRTHRRRRPRNPIAARSSLLLPRTGGGRRPEGWQSQPETRCADSGSGTRSPATLQEECGTGSVNEYSTRFEDCFKTNLEP
ncbi:hypothetical protein NDU88_006643 [Pleurodeles waltl]|uniref:Retrotransposon gag domain-containing protein n=1 Tax=Pleurodeles waltl TaxID=8319 RepID=A0AAV7X199_PLEWA|nr:hypothetical protein NDU88_006643 [Pleurodeles waltl]